jgi:indole-3-glycerol phosphate synthase
MTAVASALRSAAAAPFVAALHAARDAGRLPVIAEIKPSSPLGEDLLRGRSPESVAAQYVAGGAACLSVVTGARFGGSLDLLVRVAARTTLPVLRKDLIARPDDVAHSRDAGAQAVLLTAGLLAPRRLAALVAHARTLGVTPFVEVTTEPELAGALAAGAPVVAVNHKSIARWECDPPDFARAARLRDGRSPGHGPVWVAASGIADPSRALWLAGLGYDALLIGTALLRASDAERELRRFTCCGAELAR